MSLEDLLSGYPVCVESPIAWGDMDAYQHVNNTRYFRFFEDARIVYFERSGVTGAAGMPSGVGPILASTSCRFKYPVSYPDTVHVGARVVEVGSDRFEMSHRLVSEEAGRIAAEGTCVVVSFDYDAGHKVDLPDAWVEQFQQIEGAGFAAGREES